jgi:hypothetical protein
MIPYRDPARPRRRRGAAATVRAFVVTAGCLWPLAVRAMPGPTDGVGEQGLLCRHAMQQAEIGSLLPQSLLEGIARVESGRPDPATGRIHPWPWTINAEGQGSFFPTKAEAIAFTRQLQARGVQSIDVGCLQINLMHHPDAFHSLEEAFDPDANARYAVRFLTQLRDKTGDWQTAAAWYHSASPELGIPYREKVVTAMAEEAKGPAYDTSAELPHAGWPMAVASLSGMLAGHARIIMLPPASTGVIPARANAMVARATLASTNFAGMGQGGMGQGGIGPGGTGPGSTGLGGLGGAAGRVAMSVPPTGGSGAVGRGLAAYRMQPVAIVMPTLIAAR